MHEVAGATHLAPHNIPALSRDGADDSKRHKRVESTVTRPSVPGPDSQAATCRSMDGTREVVVWADMAFEPRGGTDKTCQQTSLHYKLLAFPMLSIRSSRSAHARGALRSDRAIRPCHQGNIRLSARSFLINCII